MPPTNPESHETQPPSTSHPVPRRTSPESSVTLQHHRLAREARDASLRASHGSDPPNQRNAPSSPRRDSSGESHETGQSDAKKWFDQSNQNPMATFDSNAMDVDPPFYQKSSDSSNDPYQPMAPPKHTVTQSSSADDYRSVIDDLTVEIQKLKEELKRYKQRDPEMLRKDKLFEIKIHGLPKRKRRELEATLREFAAGLGDSPPDTSSTQRKNSRHANRDHMYSGSGSMSKHASSSSGSHTRPVDSAYASMSTGANSSGTSLNRPFGGSRSKLSDQKVQNYLRDIPEGLYPRHMAMTEKEKKKLVVRRLEQIFTGKISGRHARHNQTIQGPGGVGSASGSSAPVTTEAASSHQAPLQPPPNIVAEPAPREARILPHEQQSGHVGKKSKSQDMGSASNSNGDQTESGGNGNGNGSGSGTGTNTSPPTAPPPDQRPTRPKDLDPDRIQIPSENMEYIRHLGLVPPELLPESPTHSTDVVRPDAEGWVYLNLLCNMAQLHIINVTPDFVRAAVADLSAKFQLSPDGRKIRWRGGSKGTKFSSDSSGDSSQRSPETDDTENTKGEQRKKYKASRSTGEGFQSVSSGKNVSKFGPQVSGPSESFHYKPLFVKRDSNEQSSMEDDTLSSFGPVEDSNGDSRWGQSGSGVSNRRKRRHDGAIIYYSGAPFCTDLSGDPGDVSPATYILSSGQERVNPQFVRPLPFRSESGSSLTCRPLSDIKLGIDSDSKMDVDSAAGTPELATDSGEDLTDLNLEFPWSDEQQFIEVHPLEPCGLGGVLPEDHFMVVVTTRRSKEDAKMDHPGTVQRGQSEEITDSIINRLATMSTSSPRPLNPQRPFQRDSTGVEIEYLSGRIKRLVPVPLPPPAIFFPPFSPDSWSEYGTGSDGDDEFRSSEEFMSRQANPHQSDDYPDGVDLSSGDEDGEDPDDEPDNTQMYDEQVGGGDDISNDNRHPNARRASGSTEAIAGMAREKSNSASVEAMQRTGGSSAATAGGVGSGYSSSGEDSG